MEEEYNMVLAFIGESCTGKSTVADVLQTKVQVEIISGKDYLRWEKNPQMAEVKFKQYLAEHEASPQLVLFVISEPEHLKLLPEHHQAYLFQAPLDVLKDRFAQRMGGKLPPPVAMMLERKHGQFDAVPSRRTFNTAEETPDAICSEVLQSIRS